ncbi:Nucleolar protein,Nop52 containing protein [Musa troglodytarum]|uniref:Nucleolar protein,Nop52 containing protein n=1 Tax=Musa troglodytarum TaxID=320322 RepID=A0A9E7G0H2_9LILI|nr:Nucleolar protein,Nop52 containing protein [Musa troglodytarum]
MDAPLSGADIAKRLASCNKAARDRAVRALSSWLCRQSDDAVSDADLAKIWKGLFYCVWHADKLPVQADLASRLAALLESVSAPLAARYFEAFLLTIRREWSGIDFLRLDKFYLLIRRFLCHAFLLLRKNAWDPELTARLTGILLEKSLLSADNYPANGVNYHVAEVFLDEIRDLLPLAVETLDLMLNPFVSVLKKSADKVLVNKIKINVFDRLLENGRKLLNLEKAGDKIDSGNEVEKLGKNDLDKSGIHISVQHLENGSSENVSSTVVPEMQVEVKNGCGDSGSDDKRNKKRKSLKECSDSIKKKKSKSGKKKSSEDSVMGIDVVVATGKGNDVVDDVSLNGDAMESHGLMDFDECMISNLQRQFEKVAAEAGMTDDNGQFSVMPATPVAGAALKRRRRAKSADVKVNDKRSSANSEGNVEKSGDKSAKKVRFSMKSNLVWKPNNPLPPQSLRLPPSATPKGSALKQGVPPGPIRETPPTIKKIKVKATSVKKSRKGVKSPAIKRLRKLQSLLVQNVSLSTPFSSEYCWSSPTPHRRLIMIAFCFIMVACIKVVICPHLILLVTPALILNHQFDPLPFALFFIDAFPFLIFLE